MYMFPSSGRCPNFVKMDSDTLHNTSMTQTYTQHCVSNTKIVSDKDIRAKSIQYILIRKSERKDEQTDEWMDGRLAISG